MRDYQAWRPIGMVSLALLLGGAAAASEPTGEQLTAERAGRIQPVPAPEGDYVIGMAEMLPAWEGMEGVRRRPDAFGPGMDGLEVFGGDYFSARRGWAAFIKLRDIQPGRYYLGLWQESGTPYPPNEYWPYKLLTTAYLNGWPVRFATCRDPIQVKSGVWLTELQTAEPVELKPGDELAFCPAEHNQWTCVLRWELYRQPPRRGHGITGQTFGVQNFAVQRLRLVAEGEIAGDGRAGSEHTAVVKVCNPLPYTARAEVTWKLADYFGAVLTGRTEVVELPAHQVWTTAHRFVARSVDQAYQLDIRTRPAPGFRVPVPRPVEWLELNDWTRWEFKPSQPGPLTAWMHVRRDLTENRGPGYRRWTSLDGDDWGWAWLEGRRVPEQAPTNLVFQRCRVPFSGRTLPEDRFGRWYRKVFRVPEGMRGQSYQLQIMPRRMRDVFGHEATVFLNGQRLRPWRADEEPCVFALGAALRPEEDNELLICVRGVVALVESGFVDRCDPRDQRSLVDHQEVFGHQLINWADLPSVWLHALPAVRVRQAVVLPDVARRRLRVMARVENEGTERKEVRVCFNVEQEGRATPMDFPEVPLVVPPGECREVAVDSVVRGLKPYTPAAPVLCRLEIELREGQQVVDRHAQRFGYRSVEARGQRMLLNGRPVYFLGSAGFAHWPASVYEREDGITVSRGSYFPDVYDEIGYFYYPGDFSIGGERTWGRLRSTNYWASYRRKAEETVWEHGSRPGVIGWEVCNETYCYARFFTGEEGQQRYGELISGMVRGLRERFGWPYWCIADGDDDLGGRLDFASFHYLNHGTRHFTFTKRPDRWGFFPHGEGVAHFPPDCFFLNWADEIPKPGTVLGTFPPWVYGTCPMGDTESFWITGPADLGMVKYLGDAALVSSAHVYYTPRGSWWRKLSLEGYRDAGALVTGMYFDDFLGAVAQAVSFSMPQQEIRYYGGSRFERRVNLHDDEYRPGTVEFRWRLYDPSAGRVLKQDRRRARTDTTWLKRTRMAFTLPKVSARTPLRLEMELWKDGQKWAREERLVEVWPAAWRSRPAETLPASMAVYDPQGELTPCLEELGVSVRRLAVMTPETLAGVRALVVAPLCPAPAGQSGWELLREFVRAGGRVLVLRQEEAHWAPPGEVLEKAAWFSMSFVRLPDHPAMRGLADRDFAMWNPRHLVAQGAYRKPAKGNSLTLLDGGHDGTMAWSLMVEWYAGKGSLLAVQLPLVEKFYTEPMAAEILRRLLAYLAQPVYRNAENALTVLEPAREEVLQALQDVRARYTQSAALSGAERVVMVDLGGQRVPASAASLRKHAEAGAVVVVHRARPDHAAWLEELLGRSVTVEVQPWQSWTDRQILERRDDLAAGLSNSDYYWRPEADGQELDALYQISNGVKKGRELWQVAYLVRVEGVKDYLFPGGLVEVPVGAGRVIVDQVRWELPAKVEKELVGGSPRRVLSVLLTNLGVEQREAPPKPALPPGVAYEPIDISALANRGFRDELSGDGEGWVDWGPEADLRSFPTGLVSFAGVPYLVPAGDRNAIVLRGRPEWLKSMEHYPDTVAIPVNKKHVAGLYFLHTGGWAYGLECFGERQIEYADGTREVIKLDGSNMGDWNFGRDSFPDEEGTLTTVAWKGSCPQYPVTHVYQTLWVNPHPEKEIVRVVLSNAGLPEKQWRFIPHLGLTVALLPERAVEAKPGDRVRAQALLEEALRLRTAGEGAAARGKLEEALEADGTHAGVWEELGKLRAETDTPEAFRSFCASWTQAVPNSYAPYNALGAFFEKQGQWTEALAAYEQSLAIEWNQPPIIEAVRRLKARQP